MNGFDYDIIIYNKQDGYLQLDIAIVCYNLNIPVINIGSLITEAKIDPKDRVKKQAKIMLRDFSERHNQVYLTWGFLKGHKYLISNPELEEFITIADAAKEVIDNVNHYRQFLR